MATKIRLEFLNEGFQQVINSSHVRSLVESTAQDVAARAGDGFEVTPVAMNFGGSPRPGATIRTTDDESRKAEAERKALSRAVGAG